MVRSCPFVAPGVYEDNVVVVYVVFEWSFHAPHFWCL